MIGATIGAGRLRLETTAVVAWRPLAVLVGAAGCALLAARPLLLGWTSRPVATLLLLFGVLLVIGLSWPADRGVAAGPGPAAALAAGLGAFAVARLLGGGEPPVAALWPLIALNTVAAVSEEAFFRRFLYDTLLKGGTVVAVAGTAVLFALVHVTIYGLWALPVDLAAGLVLSWQRWATGSWHVPALTHALANVLVVI